MIIPGNMEISDKVDQISSDPKFPRNPRAIFNSQKIRLVFHRRVAEAQSWVGRFDYTVFKVFWLLRSIKIAFSALVCLVASCLAEPTQSQ